MANALALELARRAVAAHERGIAGVAGEIGYKRPTLSRYLNDDYPGAEALEAAILSRYNRRDCPHTGETVAPETCRRRAHAPKPYGGAARERQWLACQSCQHKPNPQEVKHATA